VTISDLAIVDDSVAKMPHWARSGAGDGARAGQPGSEQEHWQPRL